MSFQGFYKDPNTSTWTSSSFAPKADTHHRSPRPGRVPRGPSRAGAACSQGCPWHSGSGRTQSCVGAAAAAAAGTLLTHFLLLLLLNSRKERGRVGGWRGWHHSSSGWTPPASGWDWEGLIHPGLKCFRAALHPQCEMMAPVTHLGLLPALEYSWK